MLAFGAIGNLTSGLTADLPMLANIGESIGLKLGAYGGTTGLTKVDVTFDGPSIGTGRANGDVIVKCDNGRTSAAPQIRFVALTHPTRFTTNIATHLRPR